MTEVNPQEESKKMAAVIKLGALKALFLCFSVNLFLSSDQILTFELQIALTKTRNYLSCLVKHLRDFSITPQLVFLM